MAVQELIGRLAKDHWLTEKEYEMLLTCRFPEVSRQLRVLADRERRRVWGTRVFLRGVVEVSSICENDCLLCPRRKSSALCERYRLRPREILDLCDESWVQELDTVVLRTGYDTFYTDRMLCALLDKLRLRLPGCALTLAMGERRRNSYEALYNSGADRYLLLEETTDRERYEQLHPAPMSWNRRLHCLSVLKDIGYQTGCGFLVGVPGQTAAELARELKFLEDFQPHSVDLVQLNTDDALTDDLISIVRLMLPEARITAPDNRVGAVLAGANVLSLSLTQEQESAPRCGGCRAVTPATPQSIARLARAMSDIGFEIDRGPGDRNG